MTREQYLLNVAAEECAECAQRLLKAARFGMDQVQPEAHSDGRTDTSANPEQLSNRERVEREYSHVVASMEMLKLCVDPAEVDRKIQKVERYAAFSRDVGVVKEEKGEPTHYVHCNAGDALFVKEAAFFIAQGGLCNEWGKVWRPVVAKSIGDARRQAAKLFNVRFSSIHEEET